MLAAFHALEPTVGGAAGGTGGDLVLGSALGGGMALALAWFVAAPEVAAVLLARAGVPFDASRRVVSAGCALRATEVAIAGALRATGVASAVASRTAGAVGAGTGGAEASGGPRRGAVAEAAGGALRATGVASAIASRTAGAVGAGTVGAEASGGPRRGAAGIWSSWCAGGSEFVALPMGAEAAFPPGRPR